MPDCLDEDKKKCFLKYFVSLIEKHDIFLINESFDNQGSISQDLNCLLGNLQQSKICKHTQLVTQSLSRLDELMIKENQICDNIRLIKYKIGENLKIYDFEWIFNVHSIIEDYNSNQNYNICTLF